jgi:hypothetical protein
MGRLPCVSHVLKYQLASTNPTLARHFSPTGAAATLGSLFSAAVFPSAVLLFHGELSLQT